MVGETGFEPATSWSPNQALYQTELLPVFGCTPDLSGGVEKAGNIGYPPAKGNPIFQDTRD